MDQVIDTDWTVTSLSEALQASALLRDGELSVRVMQGAEPVFATEGLIVDLARRVVTRDGAPVNLSPREYDLLRQLVIHAGEVLTHQHLLREVWGPAHLQDTPCLRVYAGQLRQKMEADPAASPFA